MTLNELRILLTEIGVQPSRRLGQNFLVDANLAEALLRPAALEPGLRVLEVGPGTGMLTRRLLAAGCQVTAVEFDWRLAAYLRQALAAEPGFSLLEADACLVDYATLMGGAPYICVANLPYAISSVLLARLLELDQPPLAMYLLLQREVGERIAAGPGCREYGTLSVRTALAYDAKIIRRIPATVFFPAPAVNSVQLQLRLKTDVPGATVRAQVGRLVSLGFAHRRKKLAPLLAAGCAGGIEAVNQAFLELGINPAARAEDLAASDYLQLAARLTGLVK